jgi:hypothetical protein
VGAVGNVSEICVEPEAVHTLPDVNVISDDGGGVGGVTPAVPGGKDA